MAFVPIRETVVRIGGLAEERADLFILPVAKDELAPSGGPASVVAAEGSPVRAALGSGDFKGDPNETLLVYGAHPSFPRVLLLGIGLGRELTLERIRSSTAAAARRARDLGVGRAVFPLPFPGSTAWSLGEQLATAAEGAYLGTWQYTEYKTVDREKFRSVGQFVFVAPIEADPAAAESALHRGRVRAEGVLLARDLAHTPANILTPTALARQAEQVAREAGLRCTILERADCEALGMGAFLSVARGSDEAPKFIVLEYDSNARDARKIGLVGKGITFDSGGISIKPAANMHEMKFDMAGAAAVLGAMKCLRALSCPVDVVAAIPACENLPSGRATRPGDVVKTITGKTVEVLNTDAEGRLILADALGWIVRQHRPEAVIATWRR